MKSKRNSVYKQSSATCFDYKSHLQAVHIIVVGNIYYSAMSVIDEISSYIKMGVL